MKMLNNIPICLLGLILLLSSCEVNNSPVIDDDPILTSKEDSLKTYSPVVSFEVTGRLHEGKLVTCIEPDYKGNTWIAGGKELFHYKNGTLIDSYILDFSILDISIAGDESLWIGTNGGGLGHLTKEEITWFTKENSGLPRDYIACVEVGLDGKVWFSSCAHDYGGLVVYDGKTFILFSPENTILNQHVIADICIDHSGTVYVMTLSKVTRTNVYSISGDTWKCLGNETGTFYWVMQVTVSPSGIIYLFEDFMLSSSSTNINKFYTYRNNKWSLINTNLFGDPRYLVFMILKADRRGYCWAVPLEGNSTVLHVFNGNEWLSAPAGLFNGDMIKTIETDFDNNIWVGTEHNGVFILKQ